MATREYVAEGGMRLLLDEPIRDPLMAAQVKAGKLRPVKGAAPDVAASEKSQVVTHGSQATSVDRVGVRLPSPEEKPGDGDHVSRWATYATRLGLLATQASTMSLRQLQEWVDACEEEQRQESADSHDERPSGGGGDGFDKVPSRPNVNDKVADWRAYAISLGMPVSEADATAKPGLIAWVDAREQAAAGQGQE